MAYVMEDELKHTTDIRQKTYAKRCLLNICSNGIGEFYVNCCIIKAAAIVVNRMHSYFKTNSKSTMKIICALLGVALLQV